MDFKIKRVQFTAKDSEWFPEFDNKEYLDYKTVKTNLSEGICSYGYQIVYSDGSYKWITKALANSLELPEVPKEKP